MKTFNLSSFLRNPNLISKTLYPVFPMAFSPTLYTPTSTPLPSLSLPHTSVSVLGSTAHSSTRLRSTSAKNPAGYLSVLHRAVVEEEEYRKARAEVNRKGTELEGLSVEGFSIGGLETCIVLPTFNSVFDIGRCPSRAVNQDFLFITHAHLDHIGSLPMYLATRGLYNLKPPTVFVPPCIKEDVERLLEIHCTMSNVELNVDLVALDVGMDDSYANNFLLKYTNSGFFFLTVVLFTIISGETYEIRNDLVARPFKTHHVIPSQGYIIYSLRKKLKKKYAHLNGTQIKKLKSQGVEITDLILAPEVAITGDTTSDFILDPKNSDALRAKVLITEATFLDEENDVEHAKEHGHMHIFEIMEHAQWFRNKAILLTHFSSRYTVEDIRLAVSKLQSKLSCKVVPLTEGFRSAYT
ncbi:Ribonuclease Z [Rhynchospora pubera]|uniref:Ribonuclease Z n=1 Tax=Rhynchospora pubera TaxID=906938 RepID=A0AAV8BX17_9POAL|nr:Ribonuclease Z [Rhynchospora pubera]